MQTHPFAGCPKGNTGVAVGETYGNESTKIVTALEGPDVGLEQVPLVEFYSRLQKQFPILLFERGLAVVFFLSLDVFDQVVDITLGAGQGGVSLLPVRKALEHRVRLDPERGAGLDVLHEIRQADRGVEASEDV